MSIINNHKCLCCWWQKSFSRFSSIDTFSMTITWGRKNYMRVRRGKKGNWLILFYRFQLIRRQKHVAVAFNNHIMNENWCNVLDQHFFLSRKKFPRVFSFPKRNHIIGSDCIQFSKTIFMSFIWNASARYCFHPVSSPFLFN